MNLANVTGHFGGNLGNYTVCLIVQSRNNRISWIADWRFLINGLFLTIEIGIIDATQRKINVRQRPTERLVRQILVTRSPMGNLGEHLFPRLSP